MSRRKKLLENRKQLDSAMIEGKNINERRQEISNERERVAETLEQAPAILESIDERFAQQTQLKKKDIVLLFSATALQVIRQYLLRGNLTTSDDRPDEKLSARNAYQDDGFLNRIEKKEGWSSDSIDQVERGKGYYHPTLEEIITRPVPFDTQTNAGYEKFNLHLIGEKSGLGGSHGHRMTTLGHDPILGLVFGTANIATRTATVSNMSSFHIRYGLPDNLKKNGDQFERVGDHFAKRADTVKVLHYGIVDPIQSRDANKMEILMCSLVKELIHLKSDINSKMSLPLPFTTLTPELAKELSKNGIDMANMSILLKTAAKQAGVAVIINVLINLIHAIMYDEKKDGNRDLYQVRTRKILAYSNLLATSSNVIEVGVKVACKDYKGALQDFDLGGTMVTIAELFRDAKFIARVKEEFLRKNWEQTVMGDFV